MPVFSAQPKDPRCECFKAHPEEEPYVGPQYTHLTTGPTIHEIRTILEGRTGVVGDAIRIVEVHYQSKEGATTTMSCPEAKRFLRRDSKKELFCAAVKHR